MISVICCTMRDDFIENVFQNYEGQNYKKKELIIILNKDDMDIDKWKKRAQPSRDISVYRLPEKTSLGECLNIGVEYCKYDIISKFDDDDYYSSRYLSDQLKTMKKMNADVVCKRTVYMYFEKKNYLAIHLPHMEKNAFINKAVKIKGATLMIKKGVFNEINFSQVNRGEDTQFLRKCLKKNISIYVTDERNYVCLRRYEGHHTWNINNRKLLKESKILCTTENFKKIVEGN